MKNSAVARVALITMKMTAIKNKPPPMRNLSRLELFALGLLSDMITLPENMLPVN
jgi:hypothetical protein